MREAVWTKGKRTVKGRYSYNRAGDFFYVEVDMKDPLTGSNHRSFTVYDDTPEWNGWKLQRTPIAQQDRATAS
jgi:hypothetical protein